METIIITALIIMAIVAAAATIVTSAKESIGNADEPTIEIDYNRLCSGNHIWDKVKLIHTADMEAYKANPSDFLGKVPESLYCNKCGYLAQQNRMLKRPYLERVNAESERQKFMEQRRKDINELRERFFEGYIKYSPDLTPEEQKQVRRGFDLYESFVDSLPELVYHKEAARKLEQLKEMGK